MPIPANTGINVIAMIIIVPAVRFSEKVATFSINNGMNRSVPNRCESQEKFSVLVFQPIRSSNMSSEGINRNTESAENEIAMKDIIPYSASIRIGESAIAEKAAIVVKLVKNVFRPIFMHALFSAFPLPFATSSWYR